MHSLYKATIGLLMQAISAIAQKRFGDGSVIKPSEGIHNLTYVDHRGCESSTLIRPPIMCEIENYKPDKPDPLGGDRGSTVAQEIR
jgi:hypothetical protein